MGLAISKVISIVDLEKLKSVFTNNNIQDLSKQINEELNSLESTTVNIAITGISGAGKSSLVNALRGMSDYDVGSATVDSIEATKKPEEYKHPVFPNVTVWDLPGIGTPEFQANEYLQKTDFKKYDFFIIVSAERFTQNDVFLAKEIQKMKKKYYFVRSKVDQSMMAEKRNPDFCDEKSLKKIREYCCGNLRNAGESNPRVFLLSSWNLSAYDFPLLETTMEKDLDGLKREVIIESMPAFSVQALEKKKAAMETHIWKVALVSCAIGAIPVPGFSLICNFPFLLSTMGKFRKVFGLDEESLHRLAKRVRKPVDELKSVIKKVPSEFNKEFVSNLLTDLTVSGTRTAIRVVLSFIPGLNCLAGGAFSFVTTYYLLKKTLNDMMEDAENVRAKAAEYTSSEVQKHPGEELTEAKSF